MDEVVPMHRAAQAVDLILEVGGERGQPEIPGPDLYSQPLSLIAVVAQRDARQSGRPPVPIHLAVEEAGILELGTDVCVRDTAGEAQFGPAPPVRIVSQPRFGDRTGGENQITEGG